LRLPLDHGPRCCLPIPATQDCYENPRLVDFPAPSTDGLRHPCRAGRARCFTTPKPAGVSCQRRRRAFPPAFDLPPTSACPCRTVHSRSRLPQGEPGRRSALAEDPREPRQGRFHHPPVKASSFPDLGHLPPMSTLRGCSSGTVALPPPPVLSPSFSPAATDRNEVRPLATPRSVSLSAVLREVSRTLTDFCNTNTTRGQRPRTPRPPLSGAPLGAPRPRSFVLRKRARRAGRRAMRLLPRSIRTGHPGARAYRAGRSVCLLQAARAPVVALPWLARGRRLPVLPGAPRPGFPAPSRKGALPHEPGCIPPSGPGYSRRDCSHPVAPAGLPSGSSARGGGREEPAPLRPVSRLHL
jgi:hypothetical protein